MTLATWPNYHDPANFEAFTAATGAAVQVNVFGSNEEMLAKLQAGGTGWDVFVPTNYTISTYQKLGIIEPLDLAMLPNFDAAANEARFTDEGTIDGKVYAVPKDWGTTGYIVNTAKVTTPMTSWKEFWDMTQDELSGRVMVHDYQLTTIGNALKYFGYSFNSIDPNELAKAEELLLKVKPHLFAITSDYQPACATATPGCRVCWTGDATQLHRDMPEMQYVLGKEGGEIWSDFYAVPKDAPNRKGGYALINFLLDPAVNAKEVQRARLSDHRRARREAAAEGDPGEPDPLPGAGAADAAGVRRRRDADRPEPGRDHGAVQGGVKRVNATRSIPSRGRPYRGTGAASTSRAATKFMRW